MSSAVFDLRMAAAVALAVMLAACGPRANTGNAETATAAPGPTGGTPQTAGCAGPPRPAPVPPASILSSANPALIAQPAGDFVVAPDERHVAVMRNYLVPACQWGGPWSQTVGTLSVVTLDTAGAPIERVVGTQVALYSIFFSDDSQTLAFVDNVDPCAHTGNLKAAAPDGTGVRRIHDQVTWNGVTGATLHFQSLATHEELAVPIGGGTPVSLGCWTYSVNDCLFNSAGTAVAYTSDGSILLVELPCGTKHVAGLADIPRNFVWSNAGRWLAYVHERSSKFGLALIAKDGTMRTELSTDCCQNVVFAPDDSAIVYDAPDGMGGTRLVVHSLTGGNDVSLTGLPPTGPPWREINVERVYFSHDGTYVLVTVRALTSGVSSPPSLYAAPVRTSGPMRLLTTDLGADFASAPGDAYVAMRTSGGVEMLPLGGGAAVNVVSVSGTGSGVPDIQIAGFEPSVAKPRLLLTVDSGLLLAATDGSSAKLITVPNLGYYGSNKTTFIPIWFGHTVVYQTGSLGFTSDVHALSDDATSDILLSGGADAFGWARVDSPHRLFFTRRATTGAGPAGLWVVGVP